MENYMTCKEAASLWNVTERRIAMLCQAGRIYGATKIGKSWIIPTSADRPHDGRTRQQETVSTPLPLPVGLSNYKRLVSEYYYVDKTLLIKEILDRSSLVTLFTRPRRFGKTLNMDMLKTFFEISSEDTSPYFCKQQIWSSGAEYRAHQGKYPVIYLSFKDCKEKSWSSALITFQYLLQEEFSRHAEIATSARCQNGDKRFYEQIVNYKLPAELLSKALIVLSRMLSQHYQHNVIIMFDEYDTPLQAAYSSGYYDEACDFLRNLLSGALKDNPHLAYGFLTGILRIAKESIFSGLNNLTVSTVLDKEYNQYFGFTTWEVEQLCKYYGLEDHYAEICSWYDGYTFGGLEIFNPWSVVNYFSHGSVPHPYWLNTSSNTIITDLLQLTDTQILANLQRLMEGKTLQVTIDANIVYGDLQHNSNLIYSLLVMTGYLKCLQVENSPQGMQLCTISLVNKEITASFSQEILTHLHTIIQDDLKLGLWQAIRQEDVQALESWIQKYLYNIISYHDTSNEAFYHGLMLGLCALLNQSYKISSNRESGLGRYDIQLQPLNNKFPGLIWEIKCLQQANEQQLAKAAITALEQIQQKDYVQNMRNAGIKHINIYGIAFSGKQVIIKKQ